MRKKLLIFGHYGIPNWGDEAIISGILSQIDVRKHSVTVVSNNPKFSVEQAKTLQENKLKISGVFPPPFGIRSFLRGLFSLDYGLLQTKRAIQEADFIAFGGGGLFQDRPEKAIKIWSYYLTLCQKLSKKTVKTFILGNSFEELSNTKNSTAVKKLFHKIPFFSVRDIDSKRILEKRFEVPSFRISESSDAAYFLPRNSKQGRKKGVLLAIREGEIPLNKQKKLLKIIQEYFPNEANKNEIEVVIMQEKNEKNSGDKNFAIEHNLPTFQPKNLEELRKKIQSSKFILTSRLHTGILANISGTPFVAISTRDKISQFFGKEFSFSLQKIFTKKGEKEFRENIKNYKTLKTPQRSFYDKQMKKLNLFFPDLLMYKK